MNGVLTIERSTATQSVAWTSEGKTISRVLAGADVRTADWPLRVREFLSQQGATFADVRQIVIGVGPGSFAGIRAALAFAQGLAQAGDVRVMGLSSALALTRDGAKMAVIGDARRERYWVLLTEGTHIIGDFTLVSQEGLAAAVPEGYSVATPDGARIDTLLGKIFAGRYAGALTPLASRLAEVAAQHPECLKEEPLPIYLQAAVRGN